MPVKGGWEGVGEGGRGRGAVGDGGGGEAAAAENIVADGVERHEVRVDLALPVTVGYRQDTPSDGQIRHRIQESQMGARAAA